MDDWNAFATCGNACYGDNVLLLGICFLENEMHCCMPWFKHVHDRIKEPNTVPTSTVASSQDTFELLCLFVLREKRGKSKAISWKFEFGFARFLFIGNAKTARTHEA